MHAGSKFNLGTGAQVKAAPAAAPSLTSIFANSLIDEDHEDRPVVGITAAMPGGTGMDILDADSQTHARLTVLRNNML
jgi:1-deoxy-D-xylulose-5-phosphate synthase